MATPSLPLDPPLIGQSQPLLDAMERVSRVAPLDRPVLVIGERGTGKELVAARLHLLSGRWDQPLITVNCAALPETLLETELFGHEAGAFTGAVRRRAGRFERADGGTLFLDEIADAGLMIQEKVLRVVEYGQFERVGSSATLTVDVRIIAAANADLPALAAAGRFRPDLLDRLAFDVITLPPLRARGEDVPLLADHFGRAMALELGWEDFHGFAPIALEALMAHAWPGNVRELKNVAERAVYRWPDPETPISAVQFDPFESPFRPQPDTAGAEPRQRPRPRAEDASPLPDPSQPLNLAAVVSGLERSLLEGALAANRYSQRATARHLGLTYHQLRNKIKKHGLRV